MLMVLVALEPVPVALVPGLVVRVHGGGGGAGAVG